MLKRKKSDKRDSRISIMDLFKMKLRGKLVGMIIIPVAITFITISISVSIIVPNIVNDVKKENAHLELELIKSYINTLNAEAVHGCDYIADKNELKLSLEANDEEKIIADIHSVAKELWTDNSQYIPDFITITDSYGNIKALFARSNGTDGDNMFQIATLDETSMDTMEIREALNGKTSSAYSSNSLADMYYNTAKGMVSSTTNTVIGTISLGYRLDNSKYVDDIKGNKDIDVSFFLEDERVVTTLKDSSNKRRVSTKLDPVIWNSLQDGNNSYINEIELFGKKSLGVYFPLYNGDKVAGVIGAAVPIANISLMYIILTIVGVMVIFSILFSLRLVSRNILRPISNIFRAANALSEGDVSNEIIVINTNDEIGQLTHSFKKMSENIKKQAELVEKISSGDLSVDVIPSSDKDILGNGLKKMVDSNNLVFSEIISTAEQVAVAAKQIADGSQELSIGTTQQAAAVEELTDSVSQIALRAKENEKHVNETNMQIKVISEHAEKGTVNMNQMLTAVEEIEGSSTNISKVIRVIDDIAFQTNILSLNAAVEAARAGEHGRGFAVVAEEVRNLAAKSAKAAKETSEMIEESIKKAKQGKEIAEKTSDTFNTIAEGVNNIDKLIAEIDSASKEQTLSTNAATNGADSVSKVVQTNAATAEESAAASEEMSSQASALTDLIKNQFKLKLTSKDMACELPVYEKDFGKY